MDISFLLQTLVVLLTILLGAKLAGIGLGMAGGLGLFVLTFGFGLKPASPPVDVMLIITAVVAQRQRFKPAAVWIFSSIGRKNSFAVIPTASRFSLRLRRI